VLTPEEAQGSIEWPILILVGALIPSARRYRAPAGTALIAGVLADAARGLLRPSA
jgi:di/tricarboxylate transporter